MATTFSPSPAVLAQLQENTRLQSTLTQQQIRGDRQRNDLDILRSQQRQLLENYRQLEESATDERRKHVEADQQARDAIVRLTRERDQANDMVDQLRVRVMTPQQEDMIREEVAEELRAQYRQKLAVLQDEVSEAKTELVRAQYDAQFIKTELDHEQKENQRTLVDLMEKHRIQIEHIEQDKGTAAERLEMENTEFSQRFHITQRENAQLKAKLISMENEMEERRATEELAESRLSETLENHEIVVSHVKAELKAAEDSMDGANKKIHNLQTVIQNLRAEQEQVRCQNRELEAQQLEQTSKLHGIKRQHKNETADIQRRHQQSISELEDKCTVLAAELRTWKCQADEQKVAAEQVTQHLGSKEKEFGLRLQAVRDEEWKRIAALEQEKIEQEMALSEEQRLRREAEEQCAATTDSLRQHQLASDKEKKRLVEDTEKLRQHVSQLRERQAQLEKDRTSSREVERKYRDLQLQHHSVQANEQELQSGNTQLQSAIVVLQQELDSARHELHAKEREGEQQLEELRLTNQQQDIRVQARLQELQATNTDVQNKLQRAVAKAKKIRHQGQCREQELQEQIELLQARQLHVEQEKEHVRSRMQGEIDSLKYKLKELLRRHGEFNFILHGVGQPGKASLPTIPPTPGPPLANLAASDSDAKEPAATNGEHERDLRSVHRRLAQLSTRKPAAQATSTGVGVARRTGLAATTTITGAMKDGHRQLGASQSSAGSMSSLNDFTDDSQAEEH
ncbi:golgin subfamily A member 6-like protein 22 [Sycon ciliatum]|uniref:golgin subfamily A member 6-like protein 22 n=1 Tax=Sycon ciliatum TaxID=27933 RepID=UPI0031F663E0